MRDEPGYPGCAWKVWCLDTEREPDEKNWCSADDVDLAAELFAMEYYGKVRREGAIKIRVGVREKDGTLHQYDVKVGMQLYARIKKEGGG